jgi:hypothetical protein
MVTPQQPITAVAVVVHQQLVQTLALTLETVEQAQHHQLLEHQLLTQAAVAAVQTLVLVAQPQAAAVQVETLEQAALVILAQLIQVAVAAAVLVVRVHLLAVQAVQVLLLLDTQALHKKQKVEQ